MLLKLAAKLKVVSELQEELSATVSKYKTSSKYDGDMATIFIEGSWNYVDEANKFSRNAVDFKQLHLPGRGKPGGGLPSNEVMGVISFNDEVL